MEKIINISFDNKNYNINTKYISSATDALRSHLSTVMNGTGTTVYFDDVSYNIDSSKLADAKNDFISHIETVAGSGSSIIVDGVRHFVDSAKMSGAIADLETILGSLQSGDESSEGIEKNEYGFYNHVPYVAEIDEREFAFVFFEYNKFLLYASDVVDDSTKLFANFIYEYTYDEASRTVMSEFGNLPFNDNGMIVEVEGKPFVTADNIARGAYYGDKYVSQTGETVVCNEDGSIILTSNGTSNTIVENQWYGIGYLGYISGRYPFTCSIDGEVLCIQGYYEVNQLIVYYREK